MKVSGLCLLIVIIYFMCAQKGFFNSSQQIVCCKCVFAVFNSTRPSELVSLRRRYDSGFSDKKMEVGIRLNFFSTATKEPERGVVGKMGKNKNDLS